jgi:hypothetical protein
VPPAGWGAPQPQGWAQPQQGWVQPGYAVRGPTTNLARLGAVFLDVMGILFILFGLLVLLGGAALRDIGDSAGFGQAVGGAVAVLGIVLAVIGALQLLSGLFAWRGSGGGRAGGIIFGLLFGLFGLLGLISSLRVNSITGGADTGGGLVVSLVLTIGYLYTAAVFLFAFREQR